jgi:hypothetical protein
MTVEDILKAVRLFVGDNGDDAQVWTDAKYVSALNDGMKILFVKFPESRIASTGQTVSSWTDASADTPQSTLCVDGAYQSELIEYVIYRYYGTDSGDTLDQTRAAFHLKRFKEMLAPGGV